MWEYTSTGAYLWNCFSFDLIFFFRLSLFAKIHCSCKCPNKNSAVRKDKERVTRTHRTRKANENTKCSLQKKKKKISLQIKKCFFSYTKVVERTSCFSKKNRWPDTEFFCVFFCFVFTKKKKIDFSHFFLQDLKGIKTSRDMWYYNSGLNHQRNLQAYFFL